MALPNIRPARLVAGGSAILMSVAMLSVPAGTLARNGAGGVTAVGHCTGASTSKIKLSPDNGRIEVQFEVDQNRNGKLWNVRLIHNGNVFFVGQRRTLAPSGSFELRKFTGNRAGPDTIRGRAHNPVTGETCIATATL
jgi:hypothetical protein